MKPARREAVLHVLRGSSVRLLYVELLDALRTQGEGTDGTDVLLEQMEREGVLRREHPDGERWRNQYGMEPDEPGFKDGPMYLNLLRDDA